MNLHSTSLNIQPFNPWQWRDLFLKSCQTGGLDTIKRLCETDLKTIADIHFNNEKGFQLACYNGHLDIVKFLTTSQELQAAGHTFVDIHANVEEGFRSAFRVRQFEIIKFLTTSQELVAAGHRLVPVELNEDDYHWLCIYGELEMIRFFATSPELVAAGHALQKFDYHDEQAFQLACHHEHWNLIHWLIFDQNIPLTPTIQRFIQVHPQVQAVFKAREEQQELLPILTLNKDSIKPSFLRI